MTGSPGTGLLRQSPHPAPRNGKAKAKQDGPNHNGPVGQAQRVNQTDGKCIRHPRTSSNPDENGSRRTDSLAKVRCTTVGPRSEGFHNQPPKPVNKGQPPQPLRRPAPRLTHGKHAFFTDHATSIRTIRREWSPTDRTSVSKSQGNPLLIEFQRCFQLKFRFNLAFDFGPKIIDGGAERFVDLDLLADDFEGYDERVGGNRVGVSAPALVSPDGDTEVIRQCVGLYDGPILLDGSDGSLYSRKSPDWFFVEDPTKLAFPFVGDILFRL